MKKEHCCRGTNIHFDSWAAVVIIFRILSSFWSACDFRAAFISSCSSICFSNAYSWIWRGSMADSNNLSRIEIANIQTPPNNSVFCLVIIYLDTYTFKPHRQPIFQQNFHLTTLFSRFDLQDPDLTPNNLVLGDLSAITLVKKLVSLTQLLCSAEN